MSVIEKQLAQDFIEEDSEDEYKDYGSVDVDQMYQQYCKKMFRDLRPFKFTDNIDKQKAYFWRENQ